MITVLHGDHIEASRAELIRMKAALKGKDIRQLSGSAIDASALVQAMESSSLFGGDTAVIIEDLFARLGRQQKKIEALAQILKDREKDNDIILWEGKELSATVLKHLGTPTVRLFKIPVVIFQFLDGLAPGNAKKSLETFALLTAKEAPELIFALVTKRIRQLLMISTGAPLSAVAPWQLSRLTTQAKSFRMEQLKKLYTRLNDIEFGIKSGNSAFNLKAELEQWLVALSYEH